MFFSTGILGSHEDPECPRHRGLPDGFVQAENRFRDRAHFRLDLRSALKGYIPNEEYRCKFIECISLMPMRLSIRIYNKFDTPEVIFREEV